MNMYEYSTHTDDKGTGKGSWHSELVTIGNQTTTNNGRGCIAGKGKLEEPENRVSDTKKLCDGFSRRMIV